MQGFSATAKVVGRSLITWSWTKRLLHWIIISAGTMSECVFLVGVLWVSINANVHPFVLMFMSEATSRFVTLLATTSFIALPECIVGLAVVVTIGHIRTWKHNKRDYRAAIWVVLYGLPTIVFLVLTLVTLGCSVANTTFIMPMPFVVIRALAAFIFAFTSLLYTQLGVPMEADRLAQKDSLIADLQNQNQRLNQLIETQNAELANSKKRFEDFQNSVNKSNDTALGAYSQECINWLKSGVKTANVDEINCLTGHSKRKINGAIASGNLQVSPRNKERILTFSLVEWLKKNPPTEVLKERATDGMPTLHIVNE